jgi:protein-tyrosine phosphatase
MAIDKNLIDPLPKERLQPWQERARKTVKEIIKFLAPGPVLQEVRRFRKYKPLERPLYLKIRVQDGLGLGNRKRPKAPASANSFLFVCFGNIMRSPMCEALMRKELIGFPQLQVTITSAGLNATPGRPAHPWSIAAAPQFDVSLEGHRSRLLNAEMVNQADAIFAMDYQNQIELLCRYPSAREKVFMLSAYAGPDYHSIEIRDPFDSNEEETVRCYGLLRTCVHNLVSSLAASSSAPSATPQRPLR